MVQKTQINLEIFKFIGYWLELIVPKTLKIEISAWHLKTSLFTVYTTSLNDIENHRYFYVND